MFKTSPLWIILAFALTACGGGGSSSTAGDNGGSGAGNAVAAGATGGVTGSPAGLYHGTTSNGRSISGIVLENGEYWLLYSPVGNPNLIAGADQGHASFTGGTFSSGDLKDFNLEGLGISNGTVSGTYAPASNIAGSVAFSSSVVNFSASYDTAFSAPTNQAAVAGNYSGLAAVVGGTEPATLTVTAAGALSGVSQRGCRFSGAAIPRATGNVYSVSVTFAGGVCANGTSTVTGVAYFDAGTSRVYAAALSQGRTNGFIFAGGK